MHLITLTRGCSAIVDPEDFEWADQFRWFCTRDLKTTGYAARHAKVDGRKGLLWLHREVLVRAVGPAPGPGYVGDHINGNRLDDRRANLRWATKSQNARNVHGVAYRQFDMWAML